MAHFSRLLGGTNHSNWFRREDCFERFSTSRRHLYEQAQSLLQGCYFSIKERMLAWSTEFVCVYVIMKTALMSIRARWGHRRKLQQKQFWLDVEFAWSRWALSSDCGSTAQRKVGVSKYTIFDEEEPSFQERSRKTECELHRSSHIRHRMRTPFSKCCDENLM